MHGSYTPPDRMTVLSHVVLLGAEGKQKLFAPPAPSHHNSMPWYTSPKYNQSCIMGNTGSLFLYYVLYVL